MFMYTMRYCVLVCAVNKSMWKIEPNAPCHYNIHIYKTNLKVYLLLSFEY